MLIILITILTLLKPHTYTGKQIYPLPSLEIENPIYGFVYNSDESTHFSAVLENDLTNIIEFRITKNGIPTSIDPQKLKITPIGNPISSRRIELPLEYIQFDSVWLGPYKIGSNTLDIILKTSLNQYSATVNYVLSD